jgi:O104-antigen biosynthesis beta-1,3-galactosyltransferase
MQLSVLMPVYSKESPAHLRQCLESLAAQTLPADEVVLVEDGPLGRSLHATIADYRAVLPIVSLPLPTHGGLGVALRAGLLICRGDYVARMDADDICVPDRFQRQVDFLDCNPQVDVVGSAIEEFSESRKAARSIRCLPASGRALMRFAQSRNPLNHMTVMFRRASVLAAGSYQHFPGFEDYHLWSRMLSLGHRLHNLEVILVQVRCGNAMQSRRGGLAYLKREVAFQLFLHEVGLVAAPGCIRNILLRTPIRLVPARFRQAVYQRFLRDRLTPGRATGKSQRPGS